MYSAVVGKDKSIGITCVFETFALGIAHGDITGVAKVKSTAVIGITESLFTRLVNTDIARSGKSKRRSRIVDSRSIDTLIQNAVVGHLQHFNLPAIGKLQQAVGVVVIECLCVAGQVFDEHTALVVKHQLRHGIGGRVGLGFVV